MEGTGTIGVLEAVIGAMDRGDIGGEAGGEVEGVIDVVVMREAERGLRESLRRQLWVFTSVEGSRW